MCENYFNFCLVPQKKEENRSNGILDLRKFNFLDRVFLVFVNPFDGVKIQWKFSSILSSSVKGKNF